MQFNPIRMTGQMQAMESATVVSPLSLSRVACREREYHDERNQD
jgi:hypothetical protein